VRDGDGVWGVGLSTEEWGVGLGTEEWGVRLGIGEWRVGSGEWRVGNGMGVEWGVGLGVGCGSGIEEWRVRLGIGEWGVRLGIEEWRVGSARECCLDHFPSPVQLQFQFFSISYASSIPMHLISPPTISHTFPPLGQTPPTSPPPLLSTPLHARLGGENHATPFGVFALAIAARSTCNSPL
jgi:hypothetical protein